MIKIFDFMNNAMVVAMFSLAVNLLYKKKDNIKTFIIKYEIKNDMAMQILLQIELWSLIISVIVGYFIVGIIENKYDVHFLIEYLILFGFSALLNLIIVIMFLRFNKKLKNISKKNLFVIVILNIAFVLSLITYIDDKFIAYKVYAKWGFSITFVVCIISQIIINCKKIQVRNIEYKIDTLDYEHYITCEELIYKEQFIIIKLKKGEKIEIPISRIKKIAYVINNVENDKQGSD